MYRWTDPSEPDGVPRSPGPPADEGPAWLTDRPEPRSSYLFGDEPEQPGPDWADAPTGVWRADAPPGDRSAYLTPMDDRTGYVPAIDHTAAYPPFDPYERGIGESPPAAWRPAADGPAEPAGRHRQKRRLRRPLVIGGAAAAATLVVSLGVGTLMLPRSDEQTEPTPADGAIAAAPAVPGGIDAAPGDALAAPSPSTAPSSLRPSPTRTATPKPSRTTAPSRQLQRSSAPSSTATRTATTTGITAELQQVVDLVNKERAKAGCKALTVDDKLMLAAQRHSQDQADHKTMSHDGSDGSDVGDRLDRVGYAWRAYGENVAWNQQTPAAVMDAWMNSPGHRANILNCSFTEIGVGVARSNGPYWTQDFGTPR
ncbi:CAP domain-containing protein [Micromonospora yasonensis]|uniref:CAP domain-containing protein n=1 Tax=Micromonospora yasonensis TaxID=1128667 RepID=UPI00222EFA50|nr:CAP domain-containing protein [Micromonospora yasonensis]MCW3840728.1 CAP domain-containing protein [Micromonospora yasonensis]